MPVRRSFVIAGAIALAAAGFWSMPDRPAAVAAQPSAAIAWLHPFPDAARSADPPASALPSAVPTQEMRERFENARNYAAFIQDAITRPEQGGRFYALLAYFRCQRASAYPLDRVMGKGIQGDLRMAAGEFMRDLQQRCAGVQPQFADEVTFLRALKDANARGMPDMLLIERGLLAPSAPETAIGDIGRAVASGDPYLIASTLELNADHVAQLLDPPYPGSDDPHLYYMATISAVCEIVGNCRNGLDFQLHCLTTGFCQPADLREQMRAGLDEKSLALFDRTRLGLLKLVAR